MVVDVVSMQWMIRMSIDKTRDQDTIVYLVVLTYCIAHSPAIFMCWILYLDIASLRLVLLCWGFGLVIVMYADG